MRTDARRTAPLIDLHCHLLPGVDDGPRTLSDSLALARLFVKDGIDLAVATPHLMPRTAKKVWPMIVSTHAAFQQALREHGIPLEVRLAAEVRISGELVTLASNQQVPILGYINQKPVLLLEFPHTDSLPHGADQLMGWLIHQGTIPLIAHPERHKTFQRHPDRLSTFMELGCLFQVTAGSLLGQFGDSARDLAVSLLDADLITVLASDAHDVAARPPTLSPTFRLVCERKNERVARRLLHEVPAQMIGATANS